MVDHDVPLHQQSAAAGRSNVCTKLPIYLQPYLTDYAVII